MLTSGWAAQRIFSHEKTTISCMPNLPSAYYLHWINVFIRYLTNHESGPSCILPHYPSSRSGILMGDSFPTHACASDTFQKGAACYYLLCKRSLNDVFHKFDGLWWCIKQYLFNRKRQFIEAISPHVKLPLSLPTRIALTCNVFGQRIHGPV